MINFKVVYKVIGSLLFMESTLLFWCFVMAFFYHEDDTLAFLVSVSCILWVGTQTTPCHEGMPTWS